MIGCARTHKPELPGVELLNVTCPAGPEEHKTCHCLRPLEVAVKRDKTKVWDCR